jgi:hypothetical protein
MYTSFHIILRIHLSIRRILHLIRYIRNIDIVYHFHYNRSKNQYNKRQLHGTRCRYIFVIYVNKGQRENAEDGDQK